MSGTSGTGAVVEGVQFSDGSVYLRWMTHLSSWAHYRSIEECVAIHGHDGATNLVWVDHVPSDPRLYASENVRWFRTPLGRTWHRASGRLTEAITGDNRVLTIDTGLCGSPAWVGSAHLADPKLGRRCRTCVRKELERETV